MEYRNLANTDIKISSVAFGAWAIGGWMWGGVDTAAARSALLHALDQGINTFDTAAVYGFGTSETLIGEALQPHRKEIILMTKYGLRWDTTKGKYHFSTEDHTGKALNIHRYAGRDSIIQECEDSLRRLKTDYIDLYQIHWPDPTTPIEESMEAVERLIEAGKVRAAGVSNYSAPQMAEALDNLPIVSNQVPYSMVLRNIEQEVVPLALEKNISILAYSPLQRGLLTGKITPGYTFAPGDHRANNAYFRSENLQQVNDFLQQIRPLAQAKGVTLAQLVIRWTLSQPGITCALVGARNPQQVKENAAAADIKLSPEEVKEIDTALAKLQLKL